MHIDDEYHFLFLSLIDIMSKMKSKTWDKSKSGAVKKELVETSASLECLLPVFWNTQTRHMLICRFIPQLNEFGSFYAISMLTVECYHIHVKKCARGKKNVFQSVHNNYSLFDVVKTEWYQGPDNEEAKDYPSKYDMFPDEPNNINNIEESLGKRQAAIEVFISEEDYVQILVAYKVLGGTLKSLITKYQVALRRKRFCYLHDWKPKYGVLTDAENRLKKKINAWAELNAHKTVVRAINTTLTLH
jgi:hypothetical protein